MQLDWEYSMDEGWQDIGMKVFYDNIWRKSDGINFVTVSYFMCNEREQEEKLAIDIILTVLEAQTASPIINCKDLNHIVKPIWDEIGETVFRTIQWDTSDEELSRSVDGEGMAGFEQDPEYTDLDMIYF